MKNITKILILITLLILSAVSISYAETLTQNDVLYYETVFLPINSVRDE